MSREADISWKCPSQRGAVVVCVRVVRCAWCAWCVVLLVVAVAVCVGVLSML